MLKSILIATSTEQGADFESVVQVGFCVQEKENILFAAFFKALETLPL